VRTLMSNAIELGPGRVLLGARRRSGTLWIELHYARPGTIAAKWNILRAAPVIPAGVSALELDLFVARRLVDVMAIGLRVVTKADHGVIVALGLPIVTAVSSSPLQGRAILYVADDLRRSAAAMNAMAGAGATVHIAGNMRQAAYAAHSNRIDLVVTDMALDDAAARELVKRLAPAIPALANRTAPDRLVASAAALLQSSRLSVGPG
jgi:CheY-like chemotaxis protein